MRTAMRVLFFNGENDDNPGIRALSYSTERMTQRRRHRRRRDALDYRDCVVAVVAGVRP